MEAKIQICCRFTAAIREDTKQHTFVSWCPELDLYSQGLTLEESFRALNETVSFWIRHCYERGILDDSLIKRGWQVGNTQPGEPFTLDGLALKKYAHTRSLDINVPMYMVADALKRGEIHGCT
jgi:predicted RNase H-like HicB family nuclease